MSAKEQKVYDELNRLGIVYEKFEHAPAYSMEDCAAIAQNIPATHVKNLFCAIGSKPAFICF